MRITHKATLFTTVALLAIAVAAPVATAGGDPVSVEGSQGACPTVTVTGSSVSGGCETWWGSNSTINYSNLAFGTYVEYWEQFRLNVDSDGHGWISDVVLENSAWSGMSGIARDLPWEIQFHANGDGTFHAHKEHSIYEPMTGWYPEGEVMLEVDDSSGYALVADEALIVGDLPFEDRIDGRWQGPYSGFHIEEQ